MAIAIVNNVQGEVFAVNNQGVRRRLQNGDQLQEGEVLVTALGSSADLDMGGGNLVNVPEQQTFMPDGSVGGPEQPDTASSALESAAAAQTVIPALAPTGVNALVEGEAADSNPRGLGEFVLGNFLVSDPNGGATVESVTINGTVIPMDSLVGSVISGHSGTLTITGFNPATGLASFTYGLTTATTGTGDTDSFTFTATDGTSISDAATIPLSIQDDASRAVIDASGISANTASMNGNVLTNDVLSADGPGVVTNAGTFHSSYGTLVLHSDGSYTYTVDNSNPAVQGLGAGQTLSENFNYTLQGVDASHSSAVLTITITGNTGANVITGGAGNELLSGGVGADTFKWVLGDQGTTETPAVDIITDWGIGTDKIDLRDLLSGEHSTTGPNLTSYLHFDTVGGTTTINVSTTGAVGTSHNQEIVLMGVDLNSNNFDSDAIVIAALLSAGKLIVDP